jgi:regulator of protease activity HflC (stomatin/prohibitin superfamily)
MLYLGGLFLLAIAIVLAVFRAPSRAAQRIAVVVLAGVVLVWTVANSVTVVPAGHVGVQDLFGRVSDRYLQPGIRVVNPMVTVHEMSVRTQEIMERAAVPSSEGLILSLDVSLLFNLDPQKAPDVYRTLGPGYVDVFVVPQLRSYVRGATAEFEAKALYTSGREVIARQILTDLADVYAERGIANATILLRNIELPRVVSEAIQQKLKAEQEAEQMRFVLDRERQEAERKRIEADGIADFQRIVAEGIDERLLRWKGIEATEKLAGSANAKVVIVGGQDGLPLILNTGAGGQ